MKVITGNGHLNNGDIVYLTNLIKNIYSDDGTSLQDILDTLSEPVIEYISGRDKFPVVGNKNHLYIDIINGNLYRWNEDFSAYNLLVSLEGKDTGSHIHNNIEILNAIKYALNDNLKEKYDNAYEHSILPHSPANAQKNVQTDWNENDQNSDSYLKNKPEIGTAAAYNKEEVATAAQGAKADTSIQKIFIGINEVEKNNDNEIHLTEYNGAVSSILTDNITPGLVLISDGYGKISSSSITTKELESLSKIDSNIQTQINENAQNIFTESTRAEASENSIMTNLEEHTSNVENPHGVTKSQIELGNVDNTADVDKPVSTLQQEAIDLAYENSNAYTDTKIANLINGAPETLDTLKEVADAIETNQTVVDALDAAIGTKANRTELETHINNNVIHITKEEKEKIANIDNGANNYLHPDTDGNKHVPANGTSNTGNYLRATSTAGQYEWHKLNSTDIINALGYDPSSSGSSVPPGLVSGYVRTGQKSGTSIGDQATAEGADCIASGAYTHAEGYNTCATNIGAHAEGQYTVAYGENSHAEGASQLSNNSPDVTYGALGFACHAEGYMTVSGQRSFNTYSTGCAHAEGWNTKALGPSSHAEGYGTTASGSYSHAEGDRTQATVNLAHAEGVLTKASGSFGSHAEGSSTIASGDSSHAEGSYSTASGPFSHAEGFQTQAFMSGSHAEGNLSEASGSNSHAEGDHSIASGHASHAEGGSTASSMYSHAEGQYTVASEKCAHAQGYKTTASNFASSVMGKYNKTMATGAKDNNQEGDVFVIGCGTPNIPINAYRITYEGKSFGISSFNSSGADYAEFVYPWKDGNPENENRLGYFVTFKDKKLVKATGLDPIIGITSGNPSIVGNADEDYYWKFERDDFGQIVWEDVPETVEQIDEDVMNDETGKPVMTETGKVIKNSRMKLSENYDPSRQDTYIPRSERPEWNYVGMIGILPVRDDGTCIPGQWCKCNDEGIATYADISESITNRFTYIVLERVTDNIVKVLKGC